MLVQAAYAMGYNLAIEFLADFEKTWELEAFEKLDRQVLQPQQRGLKEWLFLQVTLPHDGVMTASGLLLQWLAALQKLQQALVMHGLWSGRWQRHLNAEGVVVMIGMAVHADYNHRHS